MDQSQRELRRTADQAFMESLNHLGMSLHASDGKSEDEPELPHPVESPIDLEDLEAAAADIEKYMQTMGRVEAVPTDESV